jgi:hypothetical protein
MWKVYTSLEEALENIDYIKGFNISTKIKKNKYEYCDETFEAIADWLACIMINFPVNKNWMSSIGNVLGDLSSNAYKHGIRKYLKSSYNLEIYIGKKGFLCGTVQESGFLTKKQVEILKKGRAVPSKTGGRGTQNFINLCQGIFINKHKKEIYLAKFFKK